MQKRYRHVETFDTISNIILDVCSCFNFYPLCRSGTAWREPLVRFCTMIGFCPTGEQQARWHGRADGTLRYLIFQSTNVRIHGWCSLNRKPNALDRRTLHSRGQGLSVIDIQYSNIDTRVERASHCVSWDRHESITTWSYEYISRSAADSALLLMPVSSAGVTSIFAWTAGYRNGGWGFWLRRMTRELKIFASSPILWDMVPFLHLLVVAIENYYTP